MPGIELDEDGSLDGSNDLTIRGRLLSLVEKVTYLKKKQAEKPVASDSRKSCKHFKVRVQCPAVIFIHPENEHCTQ